jgi:hypothetical protein
MSENNLKLWTCYPKNKRTENFDNSSDTNDSREFDENSVSETYDHFTENFTDDNGWNCVPTNNIETFAAVSESESDIENKINSFKKYLFGDSEYADYYFYASIVALVFILILLMRR